MIVKSPSCFMQYLGIVPKQFYHHSTTKTNMIFIHHLHMSDWFILFISPQLGACGHVCSVLFNIMFVFGRCVWLVQPDLRTYRSHNICCCIILRSLCLCTYICSWGKWVHTPLKRGTSRRNTTVLSAGKPSTAMACTAEVKHTFVFTIMILYWLMLFLYG